MASVFLPPFDIVPESKQLETMSFLESCSRIAGIMDILGGKLFSPMKTDVTGNVEKIKKRFLENPIDVATLDGLIEFEKTETDLKLKEKNGLGVASSAIVWLKRSLKLILIFLERFLAKDYDKNLENLKSALKIAYKESLQDFHGWVVGKLVTVMLNAAPNRTTFAQDLMNATGKTNHCNTRLQT